MEKILPLNGNIVIEPLDVEKQESGGLIIGEQQSAALEKGKVIAIPKHLENNDIQVGSIVIFRKYGQEDYILNGEKVFIVSEDFIFGLAINN